MKFLIIAKRKKKLFVPIVPPWKKRRMEEKRSTMRFFYNLMAFGSSRGPNVRQSISLQSNTLSLVVLIAKKRTKNSDNRSYYFKWNALWGTISCMHGDITMAI